MKLEILRPELYDTYEQFLLNHPYSLFYHSPKYKDFLTKLLKCEAEYLVAMEGDHIRGVLPLMYLRGDTGRIYNSLPYYGSNGGIIADDPGAYGTLAEAYNAIARCKTTISSTVITNPFAQQMYTTHTIGNTSEIRSNYTDYRIGQFTDIAIRDNHRDEMMARIDSSARRNIRKALREGVTVAVGHTQVERLQQMHQDNIRAIGGIPKSDEFFALIPHYFTPGEDFDLYVAKKDGLVIAGLLLFYFNQTVEYFTPAIDNTYRSIQPLSFILITAMVDASQRGFARWNWGGTWASQTGVYRFKRKWGAIEQKYLYYTQLNDCSILDWPPDRILSTFPNFFVVPFSVLKGQ